MAYPELDIPEKELVDHYNMDEWDGGTHFWFKVIALIHKCNRKIVTIPRDEKEQDNWVDEEFIKNCKQ